jgi:hypothetical protein
VYEFSPGSLRARKGEQVKLIMAAAVQEGFGEIRPLDVEDGLTVERRNAGYVLPCVSRAEGTVVLSVLRSKIPTLRKRQPSGRLSEDESTGPPERHLRRKCGVGNKSDLRQLSTCRGKNREIHN